MRAFNNSKQNNGRSTTACGYCRQVGHSIGDCPHIQYDHDEWAAFRVPHKSESVKYSRWFLGDYSYWVKQVNKYYPKFLAAQKRKANPTTRKRTAPKCGFCGDPNHNRRHCPELVSFAKRLKQANANWRQAIFDKLVTEYGLGIGAAIKVSKAQSHWQRRDEAPEELIAIVDGFDLSSANIFNVNASIDSDYRGPITITALVGNTTIPLQFKDPRTTNRNNGLEDDKGRGALLRVTGYYYNAVEYKEVVARSEQPLDESWVSTGALEDEFNWLLKKRSLEWLTERGVDQQIQAWE